MPVEFFVGRVAEIERLHAMVNASARGRLKVAFVTGERGIGKSSLVAFVRRLSEQQPGTTGCHAFLGGVNSLPRMLGRTYEQLLKESINKPWYDKVTAFFGDRVRKVGLFGVTLELRLTADDLSSIVSNFGASILGLADQLDDRKAILLILDDINGLAGSPDFANWLKSLVDELATIQRPVPLCVIVVGLEERRRQLVASQPSLARVFELIEIAPWNDDEASGFFHRTFDAAGVELSDFGIDMMANISGGFPVLAQEIGDAVWRTAPTPKIDDRTIVAGIVSAAEIIGRKLLEPGVFNAIRNERYRSILGKLTDEPLAMEFGRSELRDRLSDAEKGVLDGFLKRMRKLGVIEVDPNVRGRYRFANQLYAIYLYMDSIRWSNKPRRRIAH